MSRESTRPDAPIEVIWKTHFVGVRSGRAARKCSLRLRGSRLHCQGGLLEALLAVPPGHGRPLAPVLRATVHPAPRGHGRSAPERFGLLPVPVRGEVATGGVVPVPLRAHRPHVRDPGAHPGPRRHPLPQVGTADLRRGHPLRSRPSSPSGLHLGAQLAGHGHRRAGREAWVQGPSLPGLSRVLCGGSGVREQLPDAFRNST